MSRKAEPDLLVALESEVFGEAFFRTLYYTSVNEQKREKALALWRLESQTRERILDYYHDKGYVVPSPFIQSAKGLFVGLLVSIMPWRIFVEGTLKETQGFLAVFRRLEAGADSDSLGLFAYIVAHEVAIQRFAQMESEGAQDSLAPVYTLLNH